MKLDLSQHYIKPTTVHRNLSVETLLDHAVSNKEVVLSRKGAAVVYTGKYTGRSPKDKFIVDTPDVHDKIDWGKINAPMSEEHFERLYQKMGTHLSQQENLYIFDGFAGADEGHQLHVRVISEYAYQSLFIRHLLRRPTEEALKTHKPALTVICAPNCLADPKTDGTNSEVFVVLNLTKMVVLIGGTKYAGEIKKSIFSVLNYLLPQKGALPMHSSVNVGKDGSSALFFGLSGTGKTTLSADPDRKLIGDDEHGWNDTGLFNFEGGCYAKCIHLKRGHEPLIWDAIRKGTLLENVVLTPDGDFDFDDSRHTENTRAAYPLDYLENIEASGKTTHPKFIIFLTADASGVLPPVAKLTPRRAVYHFLSGYTSKLAGTERGVLQPQSTFSAYFGAPFMPLKPEIYADLFYHYITKYKSKVYLVNTGWSGGAYGVGQRISIQDTRTIVSAILNGKLENEHYRHDKVFNLDIPLHVPGIADKLLHPESLWKDPMQYSLKANELARLFVNNFAKFGHIAREIRNAGPHV
jgi:phosphoenolpyruvate carboxykinase (ATP)